MIVCSSLFNLIMYSAYVKQTRIYYLNTYFNILYDTDPIYSRSNINSNTQIEIIPSLTSHAFKMNTCVTLFCSSVISLHSLCAYSHNYKCFPKRFNAFTLTCVLADCSVYLTTVDFVSLVQLSNWGHCK